MNQISRGWANYFRHAVAARTFDDIHQFTWWRIVRWQRTRHRWRWKDVRRWLTDRTGRWHPITAQDVILFNPTRTAIRRYRYRGGKIPTPFPARLTTNPPRQQPWRARCGESRTPGSESGLGKQTREQSTAMRPRPTRPTPKCNWGLTHPRLPSQDGTR